MPRSRSRSRGGQDRGGDRNRGGQDSGGDRNRGGRQDRGALLRVVAAVAALASVDPLVF